MMRNIKLFGIAALMVFAVACENDDNDTTKPVVTNIEIGENDTIYANEGVHVEFDAEDNDALDYYTITIHPENDEEGAFEVDTTFYENFQGLKNAHVHHHNIIVPEEAADGDYHLHLIVADASGNTYSEEFELILSHEEHVDDEDE